MLCQVLTKGSKACFFHRNILNYVIWCYTLMFFLSLSSIQINKNQLGKGAKKNPKCKLFPNWRTTKCEKMHHLFCQKKYFWQFFGYWCFYPHRLADSMSPVYGIFCYKCFWWIINKIGLKLFFFFIIIIIVFYLSIWFYLSSVFDQHDK